MDGILPAGFVGMAPSVQLLNHPVLNQIVCVITVMLRKGVRSLVAHNIGQFSTVKGTGVVSPVLKIAVENITLILVHIYNDLFVTVTRQYQLLGGDVRFLNQRPANPDSSIVLAEGRLGKHRKGLFVVGHNDRQLLQFCFRKAAHSLQIGFPAIQHIC